MLNGLLQRVVNNLVRNCLIDESYLWRRWPPRASLSTSLQSAQFTVGLGSRIDAPKQWNDGHVGFPVGVEFFSYVATSFCSYEFFLAVGYVSVNAHHFYLSLYDREIRHLAGMPRYQSAVCSWLSSSCLTLTLGPRRNSGQRKTMLLCLFPCGLCSNKHSRFDFVDDGFWYLGATQKNGADVLVP